MASSAIDIASGRTASRSEDEKAAEIWSEIVRTGSHVGLPELKDLDLQEYNYEGDVDPRLVQAGSGLDYDSVDAQTVNNVMTGDSEMRSVNTDPRLRDAQLSALLKMQEISDAGGLTAEDRANLARSQSQAAQADRGRRDAIMQNMAARGMSGSGNDLLAQLQSSQAATDRQAQEGLDINAMAQKRALEAMMQSGQMGGNIRSQDFGEQSAVAQAQDAINKFNTANQNQANQFNANTLNQNAQFNTGNQMRTDMYNADRSYDAQRTNASAVNQAAYGNRDARQATSNANTDTRNKETTYNTTQRPQQQFENEMTKQDSVSRAKAQEANYWQNESQASRDSQRDMIQGAATIGAAMISDKRAKKNVSEVKSFSVEDFLSKLSPKKFEYKDKTNGEGPRAGVMAQDLMKSDLGKETVTSDEAGNLQVDLHKLIGVQLAALKHLSDKVDKKGK